MRETLEKLLEKMGVNRVLEPYETQPWYHYDEEKGITCSAEVRMGPGASDVEAEIQFLYDDFLETDEDEADDDEDEEDEGESSYEQYMQGKNYTPKSSEPKKKKRRKNPEQILILRAKPSINDSNQWTPFDLRIREESYVNKVYNWEEKGCNFFKAAIQSILMGDLPDVEELVKKELPDESKGGGRRGRIGRKSPTVKPNQLGIGKGGGL